MGGDQIAANGWQKASRGWVVSSNCGKGGWLPRSLHSVAGAPRTARKKRPATPVGMTEKANARERGRQEKNFNAEDAEVGAQSSQRRTPKSTGKSACATKKNEAGGLKPPLHVPQGTNLLEGLD